MFNGLKSLLAIPFVVGALSGAPLNAQEEKNILLSVPMPWPSSLPALNEGVNLLKESLEPASGGTMRVRIFEPGKLVPPFEILSAVSSGRVNAGFATAGYWTGKIPAAPLFSAVPFGPEAGEYLAWLYTGNGLDLYQQMYDDAGFNVKVLPAGIISPETSGWFTKEINTPEDLQGLRMRFFGLGGKVMEKLGVSTSLLPGGEIFPAMEKGVIDATEFSSPAVDQVLGFPKIAKYNYFPGWHQQATVAELLINKDVWNSMSPRQQAVLELITQAGVLRSLAVGEGSQAAVMKANAEQGVEMKYWSDEMLATFKAAWDEVAAEQAAADPFFKKVWEDLQAFREEYKVWGQPRLPTSRNHEVNLRVIKHAC